MTVSPEASAPNLELLQRTSAAMRESLGSVVRGQDEIIGQLVCALISGGHVLLEGVPGVAKTLLARSLAMVSGLTFKRVQFTSDLLPADITGTRIFLPREGVFKFVPGPVFTDVLLADEINRTPPKTQAALLEAMEERRVTIEGEEHTLSDAFFVVATQNPVEYEGTYPLPEAETDRFMMKLVLGYPHQDAELTMLKQHDSGFNPRTLSAETLPPLLTLETLMALQQAVRAVCIEEGVLKYLHELAVATRQSPAVLLGASPRAAVSLMNAAKGQAFLDNRDFVLPDDIKHMALPVLRHRLLLRPEAEMEGVTAEAIIEDIIATTEVPR